MWLAMAVSSARVWSISYEAHQGRIFWGVRHEYPKPKKVPWTLNSINP